MPLYELLCIASASAESAPLRDLVKSTSRLVLDNGGAVRGVQYWGKRTLPQRARRHQMYHTSGDYFLLHFDTSPPVLSALSSRLRADPRVVKWTTLKLGSTLSSLVPPGLSGGDANANFNNPSSVRKMSKVFGDDLMRDLEGSKMAETLKKDLENEILASENGKFKALDEEERKKLVESLWEEVKGDVEREVTEDVGDAVLKGRSIVLGGRMIKED